MNEMAHQGKAPRNKLIMDTSEDIRLLIEVLKMDCRPIPHTGISKSDKMVGEIIKPRIMIVDDVPENIRMLIEILKNDYATIPALSGEAALKKVLESPVPDLILLDILMPAIDGYAVCRLLKENEITKDIPVIFITAVSETLDNAKAFELGAVDYITKPFIPSTVKARVKTHVNLQRAITELQKLYTIALDANPITGLPGNNSIRKAIETAIENREKKVVIYVDIDNFKPYNDTYGFARGDAVLFSTANILKETLLSLETTSTFIGHVGGDDFVMLLPIEFCDLVTEKVIKEFEQKISDFYNSSDIEAGFITAESRNGKIQHFPLISISMGGVDLSEAKFQHYLQVNDACTEVKKKAKEITGNYFFMNRRTCPDK